MLASAAADSAGSRLVLTKWQFLGATLGFLILAARIAAQEGPPALEFSFSNPGARSLGFGGAFVALADDATAAFANPAGLVQLTRPEVSIEGRHWSYSTEYVAGGRAADAPTGIGIDTNPGLRRDVSKVDLSSVSFLSFVYPRKNWAIAIYRHQLANFEAQTTLEGLFRGVPELGDPARDDMMTFTDGEIVSHALGGSYRLTETFSLGVGLSFFDIDFTSRTDDFRSLDIFGPGDFRPENIDDVTLTQADDSGLTLLAGFLWQTTERWSFGGVFREGPTVDGEGFFIAGPVNHAGGAPGEILGARPQTVELPDVYGLGTAYRSSSGAVTLSIEWDRVRYSTLSRASPASAVEDADELHLGFEYAFISKHPIVAWRLGVWLDPDHRPKALPEASVFTRAVFQGGEEATHVAGGLGLAFESFQVDLAVDFSDPVNVASVSAIYSF